MKVRPSRRFNWISSVGERAQELVELEAEMKEFYSSSETRDTVYRPVVDCAENHLPNVEAALVRAILARDPKSVLEVGCGSARILRNLRQSGYQGTYFGVEMSPEVISANQKEHPTETFMVGAASDLSTIPGRFDAIFAYFVLEHIVFPERALRDFMGRLAPGGAAYLVFPDFLELRLLPSQKLGFSSLPFRQAVRKGPFLKALVGLWDSRIRLRSALRSVHRKVGSFPVNRAPLCLAGSCPFSPDQDAVYISSKVEVAGWAHSRGFTVRFPAGVTGAFQGVGLLEIGT